MRKMIVISLFGMAAAIGSGRAHAQPAPDPKTPSGAPLLAGAAAVGDWRSDAPGVGRLITPADLPAPYASPSARNSASVVRPPATAALKVPQGFAVQRFASGLRNPRLIRVAPNGDIFVAETAAGRIRVLRAVAGAAQPDRTEIFADRLDRPFGIAFYPPGPDPRWVYVAENNAVVRYPYEPGDLTARAPAETLVRELAGTRSGHATRDLAVASDGRRIFVSVGSGSNVADGMPRKSPDEIRSWEATEGLGAAWGNETHRADVLTFDPDGKNLRVFATGIRNCVGLAVQPQTSDLWCATNERDGLGDNLVPDYVTRVRAGTFYGWPWWYIGTNEEPRHAGERPDLRGKAAVPDVLLASHSAAMEMTFYPLSPTGEAAFPADYRGDGFAALHGSWNRRTRTGYKVVRIPLRDGVPTGAYEDFLTGFVVDDDDVWGRPVGVAIAQDGALLVSDDGNGTIWRVVYSGDQAAAHRAAR